MHSAPVKFLILIDTGDGRVARLFNAELGHVMDMDASTEDVVATIDGVVPQLGALDAVWDRVLAGHSATERASAQIFTLAV